MDNIALDMMRQIHLELADLLNKQAGRPSVANGVMDAIDRIERRLGAIQQILKARGDRW